MKKIYLFSLIAFITFISSCKKDSSIGADILPSDDLLNVKFTDSFTLFSKTLADTFLRTDKLAKNYLGVINDPLFGLQKSKLALELDRPNSVFDDTLGPFTLDSVILLLKYNTIYGDTLEPQSFKVSTISNKVDENSAYFSNSTAFPGASIIGTLNNYSFQPSSRVIMSASDTVGSTNILRIKLNSFVGYSILNLGQTILRDSSQFKNSFPGIVIENTNDFGKCMAEIDINSSSSGMVIYYKDKNLVKRETRLFTSLFKIINGSIFSRQNSVNLFENSKSTQVQNVISSGLVSDSLNYMLGQGGTTVKISLPTLTNLGSVAVNKAVLLVTQIEANSKKEFTAPPLLSILKRNSSGLLDILPTAQTASSTSGFQYLVSEGVGLVDSVGFDAFGNRLVRYSINISKYVQDVAAGKEPNSDLYLNIYRSGGSDGDINLLNSYALIRDGFVSQFSYIPSRAIVAGGNYSNPNFRMKLNLTYTLIE